MLKMSANSFLLLPTSTGIAKSVYVATALTLLLTILSFINIVVLIVSGVAETGHVIINIWMAVANMAVLYFLGIFLNKQNSRKETPMITLTQF